MTFMVQLTGSGTQHVDTSTRSGSSDIVRGPFSEAPSQIVLMMLFRDEFSHGEEGSGKGHWRRDRETTMTELHRCRVVEAQQMLVGWAFDGMGRS